MIQAIINWWIMLLSALGVMVEPWHWEPAPEPEPVTVSGFTPDHSPAWNDETVARLIRCETGGTMDPTIVSKADAHGLFQFHQPSWELVGGTGLPSEVSPAEQRMRAKMLWDRQGWHGWPGCSCAFGWIRSWSYQGVHHDCS